MPKSHFILCCYVVITVEMAHLQCLMVTLNLTLDTLLLSLPVHCYMLFFSSLSLPLLPHFDLSLLSYRQHSLASMEAYDPRRNVWIKLADMGTPCSGLGACTLFGLLYTVGYPKTSTLSTSYIIASMRWHYKNEAWCITVHYNTMIWERWRYINMEYYLLA